MDQQTGWKEYIGPVIGALLGMVGYKMLKDTAIEGVILVVLGLISIPLLTIASVKSFRKKEWRSALVCAAFVGLLAWGLWFALSDVPWRQLPEEIDLIVNFYKTL